MEYKLTTIKDVFDTVPADRVDDCLRELAVIIKQGQAIRDMISGVADVKPEDAVIFPESITWVDDGKGEISGRYYCIDSDKPFITVDQLVKQP